MSQNKTSKYFKYAIGEIILVVIGILIALQINTWNQQRIENKQELELLKALKDEFEYNLSEVDATIAVNKKTTKSCLTLTKLIRADSLNKMPEYVDSLLLNIGDFTSFDARTGVSGEIVNSGKLNILKNKNIRAQLGNWLTLIADCEEDILFRSDNYTMNLMPFLMKRFPLSNGELTKNLAFDKMNYLETYQEKSPFRINISEDDLMEFENQIWHHKHNHDYVVINERNIRDFIMATIKMIEEELKSS
ncbi:hypothetical protein J4050_05070 [Winogradskyella sp. DF17]|uniref:Uncharacterized protein n=2 Tax=Winogradskyella pelagia TaxID=2819984 RepID=A0ABS3T039_9FLAO|nr:hypothetical protein [Winogradskyella sp. DF17]